MEYESRRRVVEPPRGGNGSFSHNGQVAQAAPTDAFKDRPVPTASTPEARRAEARVRYEDSCARQGFSPSSGVTDDELVRRFTGVTYGEMDVIVRRMHAGGR